MPLRHERPSVEYMRELKAVARSAGALRDYLPKVNLLPDEFPLEQVEGYCNALVRLPRGTAEGSIASLRAADSELNRIRQRFIPAHDEDEGDVEPLVPRNGDFDLRLVGFIAAIRAAIEHYKVESGEELDTDITPDRLSNPAAGNAIASALEATKQATEIATSVGADIANLDDAHFRDKLDTEAMLASDAGVQVESAAASLKTEAPRPTVIGWLSDGVEKTANALELRLSDHSDRLDRAARELGFGVREIIEINFPKLVKSLGVVRTRLANIIAIWSGGEAGPFNFAQVYSHLLRGEPVPDEWAAYVTELDFDFVNPHHLDETARMRIVGTGNAFSRLELVERLPNLKSLNLSKTQVVDFTPLANLTSLQNLILNGTQITDLSPLSNLTDLQTLYLTHLNISDLTPIANLMRLKSIDLWGSNVADVSPLRNLRNLRTLNLVGTNATNTIPLTHLTKGGLKILGP